MTLGWFISRFSIINGNSEDIDISVINSHLSLNEIPIRIRSGEDFINFEDVIIDLVISFVL